MAADWLSDLPDRGGEPIAGGGRSQVIRHPTSYSVCSPQVNLTIPSSVIARSGAAMPASSSWEAKTHGARRLLVR